MRIGKFEFMDAGKFEKVLTAFEMPSRNDLEFIVYLYILPISICTYIFGEREGEVASYLFLMLFLYYHKDMLFPYYYNILYAISIC